MSDPIVYGFPRSTFVNIIRLILTHKDVAYSFHDLEPVMGKPEHLALHPFNRVPILEHGDLTVYETSAIAAYVDEAFGGASLTPKDVRARARMNQWISAVKARLARRRRYHVHFRHPHHGSIRSTIVAYVTRKQIQRGVHGAPVRSTRKMPFITRRSRQ